MPIVCITTQTSTHYTCQTINVYFVKLKLTCRDWFSRVVQLSIIDQTQVLFIRQLIIDQTKLLDGSQQNIKTDLPYRLTVKAKVL